MTALHPHGFLLLSEAGGGVSGEKKVAEGLMGEWTRVLCLLWLWGQVATQGC